MGDFKNQDKDTGQTGQFDKTEQSDQGGKPAFGQMQGDKEQQSELGTGEGGDKQEQFDETEGQDFEKGEIQGNDMGKPQADDGFQTQKRQEEFAEAGDKAGRQGDMGGKG